MTPEQQRAYKGLKLGLITAIPVLAVVIVVVVTESSEPHSLAVGVIAASAYLALMIPTSVFILRRRRQLMEAATDGATFGKRLR